MEASETPLEKLPVYDFEHPSKELFEALTPHKIQEIAVKPNTLEVKVLDDPKGFLHLVWLEQPDDPSQFTSPESWKRYIAEFKRVEELHKADIFSEEPYPIKPDDIDRMHQLYLHQIDSGILSIQQRILMSLSVKIDPSNRTLLVGRYDGIIGKGLATELYTENLSYVALKSNLRFIKGYNNQDNLSFFTEKLGRYTYKQLTPKAQSQLFPEIDPSQRANQSCTIQFLFPEDKELYIEK